MISVVGELCLESLVAYHRAREIFVGVNFRVIDQSTLRIKFRMLAVGDCAHTHLARQLLFCAKRDMASFI